MPKYNLYRIPKDKEVSLAKKLGESGLEKIGTQEFEGYDVKFFFSKQPDSIDIWWLETYSDFLGDLEPPKNLVHFGVLLISKPTICYAISLGKSHFYLSQFCDAEFGLNLAERIIDEKDLKIKNSKFYKSAKSKMITTYQKGSQLAFDSGESMHYIKGKTIDPITWGTMVSFGTSVHFNISKDPLEMPLFIDHIEETLLSDIRVKLPKVEIVKDKSKINSLDKALANSILRTQESSDINIEEFTMSGTDFIFSDSNKYSLYKKGKSNEAIEVDELNLDSLVKFIKAQNIDLGKDINNLRVKIHNECGRDHAKPLKFYLDFIEDTEQYCLIDGIWHKFNQSYVEYLKEEVDKIEFNYNPGFDISPEVKEAQFNEERVHDGYVNYDKVLTSIDGRYKVEKLDLYRDHVAYFVKKGSAQKLSYVTDQAMMSVKILQSKDDSIKINDEPVEIDGICLWMILDRKNKIEKLSDINSMILHMNLVEWRKTTLDAGFSPTVNINYCLAL